MLDVDGSIEYRKDLNINWVEIFKITMKISSCLVFVPWRFSQMLLGCKMKMVHFLGTYGVNLIQGSSCLPIFSCSWHLMVCQKDLYFHTELLFLNQFLSFVDSLILLFAVSHYCIDWIKSMWIWLWSIL